jgi:chromosome segregation ATPase
MENYFTIKEFADIVGISTQAVYQRLDKDLKEYYNVIDGKKYLDKNVLTLFKDTIQKNESDNGSDVVAFVKTQNELLTKQVEEKDSLLAKQSQDLQSACQERDTLANQVERLSLEIERLRNEITSKDLKITDMNRQYNLLMDEKTQLEMSAQESPTGLDALKRQEETIAQLQNSLTKALNSTAELENQLSTEREHISERDNQIINKEKRLDEKETTIQNLLAQLQQANEHSQYMSTQLAEANKSLSEATFKAQELTQNQQILMKQQQDNQQLLLESNNSQPKGLFERIFGKK